MEKLFKLNKEQIIIIEIALQTRIEQFKKSKDLAESLGDKDLVLDYEKLITESNDLIELLHS